MEQKSTTPELPDCGQEMSLHERAAFLEGEADRYFQEGDFPRALALLQETLQLWRDFGAAEREADCLQQIGFLQFSLRQHADAAASYENASALRAEQQDARGEAVCLGRLAEVHQYLGEHVKALAVLERSLERCNTSANLKDIGIVLNNMGVSYRELGKREQAKHCYEQALEIRREVGDQDGLSSTLHNLGTLYLDSGMFSQARKLLEEAYLIREATGDKGGSGRTALSLGWLFDEQGNTAQAKAWYEQALEAAVHPSVRDADDEAAALHNLAGVAVAMDDPSHALRLLGRALDILSTSGMKSGQAKVLYRCGEAHAALGNWQQALSYLHQAKAIQEEIDDRSSLGYTEEAIGAVLAASGQQAMAYESLTRAARSREELGEHLARANTLGLLGRVCESLGKSEEAVRHYQSAEFLRTHGVNGLSLPGGPYISGPSAAADFQTGTDSADTASGAVFLITQSWIKRMH